MTALRNDPGSVGKRYSLTARLPAEAAPQVRAIPGVADAAPRWIVRGADSFALGEPVKLVAFPGDHTRFEDPPLAGGRRLRGDGEAEVGVGLAQALGVGLGATLAVQLESGSEVRFRVVGIVRALDEDGRVAYVRPGRLLAADPAAVGADRRAAARRRRPRGGRPAPARAGRRAGRGRRRHDAQRRLPGDAGRAAARGRGDRRARLPVRAGPVAGADRARAAADAGAAARHRRPGRDGRPPSWRGPPSSWRCPRRCSRSRSSTGCWRRWSAAWPPATPTSLPRPQPDQVTVVLGGLVVLALVASAWVAARALREPPVAGLREE